MRKVDQGSRSGFVKTDIVPYDVIAQNTLPTPRGGVVRASGALTALPVISMIPCRIGHENT